MKNIFITSAVRTAVGTLNKTLKSIPAYQLGSSVIKKSISESKLKKN